MRRREFTSLVGAAVLTITRDFLLITDEVIE
jgi:hypothetical protein